MLWNDFPCGLLCHAPLSSDCAAPAVCWSAPRSFCNCFQERKCSVMPCFWKSFRNRCVYFFTLIMANSGRWALCWKCRTAHFFQLSVPPPPPQTENLVSRRQTCHSGRAPLCRSSSDVGNALYLGALNVCMGVLGSGYWILQRQELRSWIWLQILWKVDEVIEGQMWCVCSSLCCWRHPLQFFVLVSVRTRELITQTRAPSPFQ